MEPVCLIKPLPGYSPTIGHLVSMMNYARYTTLRAVQDLTIDQLDHCHDEVGNSIGALLAHMAAVEWVYQVISFEGREPTPAEEEPWKAGLELGELARKEIHGKNLDHYLSLLASVREKTLAEFAKRDDAWLLTEVPFWRSKPGNHYFMWFHVFEDEINHRGQIRLIRKRLPKT
jgi:uncharacterized damage-inducible protein DinB